MQKPCVVILSAFLSPFRSGAEACAEEVALALAERYDITIVTAKLRWNLSRKGDVRPPLPIPPPSGEGRSDVPVIRVGLGFPFDKWLFPFLAPLVVRRLKPDIVHAVLESFAGFALVLCKLLYPKAKRILTCQSTNTSLLLGIMHRAAHRVTVISSVLKKRAEILGRGDAVLIPNGVPLDLIREACGRVQKVPGRILFVGRLEPMKGVDTLLDAFAALSTVTSRAHLRIVGDGSLRQFLVSRFSSLVHDGRVSFAGFIPFPQVYEEFARAEIFCALSRSEALGNVFLEAQAAGCAVVGSNVGGIPDVVEDGKTGILVPPDDPKAAAAALELLLQDTEKREALRRGALERLERYDWKIIAQQYAQLYEELLRTS